MKHLLSRVMRYALRIIASTALFAMPILAQAATAGLSAPVEVYLGRTFQVNMNVIGGKNVDTVRFIGTYSADLIEYQGMANGSSLPTRSPGSSGGSGSFNFGGFSLGNPVNGTTRAGSLTFKATKLGEATISLGAGTRILSAGEEQLTGRGSVKVRIVEAPPVPDAPVTKIAVTSLSHANQDAWYAKRDVTVQWKVTGRTPQGVFIGFDQAPEGPAEEKRSDTGEATFTATSDGVWYAHLVVRFGAGEVMREDFRIQIDSTAPRPFATVVDQTEIAPTIPSVLRFAALDDASGIQKYEIWLNDEFVSSTMSNGYVLGLLSGGDYRVRVRASDYAGNSTDATTSFVILDAEIPTVPVPAKDDSRDSVIRWILIIILCILLFVLGYWYRNLVLARKRKKKSTK